ncbi:TRAP transporter substrate-binding protein DctP [Marinomonas primoryensis]|uniref:TRAP-type C4-dicarboxylate transport system periplasmic protein DctP n=2 Tax=Marinomonas primoryensis TaxID=178399 RepID=A0A859D4K9_9GAMM|nr:TRAP-type C4-dicarboxylate transport system periplasmic protein DctP [Marinomonas primoryensis]
MNILKKTSNKILFLSVASLIQFGTISTLHAKEFSMLSSYAPNFAWHSEIVPDFIDLVKEKSDGKITFNIKGPDVVPAFEQLQPVQIGVFDFLFTHPAYHSGTTAVGLTLDAIDVDPIKRREKGIIDYIDNQYQKLGLKLIAAPSTGTKGFRFYLRDKITGEPGLEGRRIRGTVSYHSMIKNLGGSPVNMPVSEIYTALQRGVIDGAAWGLTGASDLQWHEVIDYMTAPVFGQVGLMIFMNLDRWNELSKDTQNILIEAGKQLEIDSVQHFDELQVKEEAFLLKNGMSIESFSDKEASELDRLWAQGVWEVGEELSGDSVRELRKKALSESMTY